MEEKGGSKGKNKYKLWERLSLRSRVEVAVILAYALLLVAVIILFRGTIL